MKDAVSIGLAAPASPVSTADASGGDHPLLSLLAKLEHWLADGRTVDAAELEARLTARAGRDFRFWRGLGDIHVRAGRWSAALAARRQAAMLAPDDLLIRLDLAEALAGSGRWRAAAQEAEIAAAFDPPSCLSLTRLAHVMLQVGRLDAAAAYAEQAVALAPDDPHALFVLAACQRQMGAVAEAAATVDQVLALDADHGEAVWLRSDLTRASAAHSHVPDLQARSRAPMAAGLDVRVAYALGKELEALGAFEQAFASIAHGASLIRTRMSYDPANDLRLMAEIRRSRITPQAGEGCAADGPIFVLGLPRTGTSLVEAILAAHPQVSARGEPPGFDRALYDLALARGAEDEIAVRRMGIELPPRLLGERYLQEVGEAPPRARFVDKRPLNVLNVALIRGALPKAKIIMVERDLRDTGWAMFKTLFNTGAYRFSYDLGELGRYLAGYRALASHWCAVFDQDILQVRYEDLVADVEGQARRMLAYCDLDWAPNCMRFHESREPATSASAVQVRRPVYNSSVGAWRRYEAQLGPLLARLDEGGG